MLFRRQRARSRRVREEISHSSSSEIGDLSRQIDDRKSASTSSRPLISLTRWAEIGPAAGGIRLVGRGAVAILHRDDLEDRAHGEQPVCMRIPGVASPSVQRVRGGFRNPLAPNVIRHAPTTRARPVLGIPLLDQQYLPRGRSLPRAAGLIAWTHSALGRDPVGAMSDRRSCNSHRHRVDPRSWCTVHNAVVPAPQRKNRYQTQIADHTINTAPPSSCLPG